MAVTDSTPIPAGQGTIVQFVPFQCSIRLPLAKLEKLKLNPTAHASVAEVTATDWRMLSGAEVLGLGTTVHEIPSQCWMSVVSVPLGSRN